MSKLTHLLGGGLSFAHLAGLSPWHGKRARAEDEDDDEKGRRADRAEDDEEDDDTQGRRGSRAEDGSEDEDNDDAQNHRAKRADDNDTDDEDTHTKRSRRAKHADDDEPADDPDAEGDDDDEEMHGQSANAQARRRERARFAAIFASAEAARNLPLAMSLACHTAMTRREVIAALRDAPDAAPPIGLGRAARNPVLGTGGERPSRHAAIAQSWDRAMAKVAGH